MPLGLLGVRTLAFLSTPAISYAVFGLKKKNRDQIQTHQGCRRRFGGSSARQAEIGAESAGRKWEITAVPYGGIGLATSPRSRSVVSSTITATGRSPSRPGMKVACARALRTAD